MSDTIAWTETKALSFDIYGTLIDWESGIVFSARATALGPFLPQDRKQLLLDIEKHDTKIQRENPTLPQTKIISAGLKSYAQELELVQKGSLSQQQVDEAADAYSQQIGSYPAFADTVAAIQSLGKRYKLIPLSNVDRSSFEKTLSGPLKGCHFDAIYTAEDIGSYKPAARNFEYLLEHVRTEFGFQKNELSHVAQSLFHDHEPAKKFDLQSVWVDRSGFMGAQTARSDDLASEFGFKLKVQSLGELAEIVERAFAKAA
ncbi:HAD-like protein [Dissoconium aciculare CBS 342.82]|uniref:HAD-like protein n=1 Tax=Dissoconium aciculare CBS 342.82 TaxID=1314786 RepID=A0A6J3MEW5_9PEZI|nr:HAD-like protein [Dissoconium aciculare CBS 342.82]KAF1826546.1 HAD-like protein [Dissoconium aciculare CBS 342.82]